MQNITRRKKSSNPRFLESKGTIKPIPSLTLRKKRNKLQREARRIQRAA